MMRVSHVELPAYGVPALIAVILRGRTWYRVSVWPRRTVTPEGWVRWIRGAGEAHVYCSRGLIGYRGPHDVELIAAARAAMQDEHPDACSDAECADGCPVQSERDAEYAAGHEWHG